MKKFWKYVLISILLLIGLMAVALLYLFFVPNASLFGITYISYNKESFSSAYNADEVNSITLTSQNYNVYVVPSPTETISVKVFANSFGFTLEKNSKVNISQSLQNRVATFNITEPSGLALKNSSYIQLRVPAGKEYNLTLKNKSSETFIMASTNQPELETPTFSNLYFETSKGILNCNKGTITSLLDLNINNGKVIINKDFSLNENNVVLNYGTGSFIANHHAFNNITIESSARGVTIFKHCKKLTQNTPNAGGKLDAGTVETVDITSADTNVIINTLNMGGNTTLSKSGKIEVGNLNGVADLHTHNGNIVIANASAPAYLESSNGNIDVTSSSYIGKAITTYGNINISFADTAGHYQTTNTLRHVNAKTHNGKITISGAENVALEITGKGSLNLNMLNVLGNNIIAGENGNLYVQFADNVKFKLATQSSFGSVSVNVLGETSLGSGGYSGNQYQEAFINGATSNANNLSISSNYGNIKVREASVAEF